MVLRQPRTARPPGAQEDALKLRYRTHSPDDQPPHATEAQRPTPDPRSLYNWLEAHILSASSPVGGR